MTSRCAAFARACAVTATITACHSSPSHEARPVVPPKTRPEQFTSDFRLYRSGTLIVQGKFWVGYGAARMDIWRDLENPREGLVGSIIARPRTVTAINFPHKTLMRGARTRPEEDVFMPFVSAEGVVWTPVRCSDKTSSGAKCLAARVHDVKVLAEAPDAGLLVRRVVFTSTQGELVCEFEGWRGVTLHESTFEVNTDALPGFAIQESNVVDVELHD